jgi:hypothetical protein
MKKLGLILNLAVSLAILLAAGGLAAETSASANQAPAQMVVTVLAQHGTNPPTLGREDVMVLEGKVRDKVVDWVPAQGNQAGLQFFVLIDDAANISLGSQLDDIRQFILAQPASAQVGVAYMQNGIARIEQNLTTDHAQAAKALRLPLGIRGVNASPYFSLSDLVKRWPASGSRREILLVSDGIDLYYGSDDMLDPYLAQTIEDLQKANIVVYAIYTPGVGHYARSYWSTYWGQLYMARVAEETGGESYYIGMFGAPVSYVPYLDDITHQLGHQYLLSFLPKPQKKTGLQPVRLMTEVPNADLVSAHRVLVQGTQ